MVEDGGIQLLPSQEEGLRGNVENWRRNAEQHQERINARQIMKKILFIQVVINSYEKHEIYCTTVAVVKKKERIP